jgi:hypothetical protein
VSEQPVFNFNYAITPEEYRLAQTSSGATLTAAAPVSPPRSAFDRPEPSTPTPMTYEDDGSVYGHLALRGSCHRGFMGGAFAQCVQPPTSRTDYKQFHLGYVQTQEGDRLAVGKITFDTDHAPLTADVSAAAAHYDNTGSVGAYVRARDGRLGIWLSGVTVSGIAPAALQSLRANPLSGDWRSLNGNLELVASLAVPVPGFPIERVQLSLAASGEVSEVETLILPGYCGCEEEETPRSRDYMRKIGALSAAVLSTRRRDKMPDTAFAIPSRRAYPIHDKAHAANALARSAGNPEAAAVRRAVCRRYPDMGSCK